ncbi:hypothetical protein [Mucilaginibacter gotjawali]|uniref:Uncharacterized protein n=2 Tax=Mucilaginibacter gotjawali TaxID=1550579 RepID=A0A110B033_9SPHI|nr:hypothetical protein [Mucilaginibacter gotjawali]MBB3059137.1 hypothetical protein [Mucilaginibacter gotjawali]BAU52120.1 hypothetical protein MgSA37_00270 [Mucilaginibacter gotjawali]
MINSKYVLTLILLGLLSCKQPKPQSVNKDIFLIGKWENCQELFLQGDGRSIPMSRNACPFIIFDKNYMGYVKMGDATITSSFNWSAGNDKLIIRQSKNAGRPFFGLGVFKLLYKNNQVIKQVVMFDTVRKVKYILER